ncbi:MAG: LVIVD repeat-containing protein, partial [bacterium]
MMQYYAIALHKRNVFILFFTINFWIVLFIIGSVFAEGMVDLGLEGHWSNNYGGFQAIEVLDGNIFSYHNEECLYYAFCATSRGMVVFSIDEGKNSLKRQSMKLSLRSFIPIGNCNDIAIRKGDDNNFYAYLTARGKGVHIIKIEYPELLYYMVNLDTPGTSQSVALAPNRHYAFVADGYSGLQVIDISDPTTPFIAGSCDTPGEADGVTLSQNGHYALVADGYSGLQVIDISDPTAPFIAGSCDTLGDGNKVVVSQDGHYALVADGYSGLQVIDISDPTAPF